MGETDISKLTFRMLINSILNQVLTAECLNLHSW